MKILLTQDSNINLIHEFLLFMEVEFSKTTLWNSQEKRFQIPNNVSQTVLIIDKTIFVELLQSPDGIRELSEFCNNSNQLWVFDQFDHAYEYLNKKVRGQIKSLDQIVKKSSVVLFLETEISDRLYINSLVNIKIKYYLNWHMGTQLRVQSSTLLKTNPTHDYLLTMMKKSTRPHRDVLWHELNSRPGLMNHELVSYRNKAYNDDKIKSWIGKLNSQRPELIDANASMDLYLDCYIEIVPETCYRDLYFFTEKTQKPIMTQTPFLIVSNANYLTYLRNLGFKTFGSLISEKYDQCYRMEDRVKYMVDVLQDIIINGTEEFYHSSQDILKHNFSRMCEISGSWQHRFDSVIWGALNEANEFCLSKIS